ncbi:MAG: 50S ribosomal protein L6 [Candidatus Odinarchaeum yellowstonii]|uniref:Large ribosomal subunit protein uL6 n=1 Tax=Odinarchaeota yellowstonii (strain LCB_4) TaxID=1841599 RepID=A0AAF0D189_ODILC|nr:MAG: 50S ribosomal protein L6 [Candidatus Odinarchaeum yellowstonii]
MVKVDYSEKLVTIPADVSVNIEGKIITATGPKGTVKKDFTAAPFKFEIVDNTVKISKNNLNKRELAILGTIASHIKNMFTGVTKGYTYKMKIVYAHFPIAVKVAGADKLQIENFGGERYPRIARILKGVTVRVEGDDLIITGADKEAVSQTAANIQQTCRIKDKDPRVFMDGIYVYQKLEGDEIFWKLI